MIVINVVMVILIGILILAISLLKLESISLRPVALGARHYLRSGPVSLAFAVLLIAVEVAVSVTGIREQIRWDFGLPNSNLWAYVIYAFLHVDTMHLLENLGALLICGGFVEERIRSRWFVVLVAFSVPLGGYLATLTAPVFIDSPWTGDLPSVGFSIVVYAVLVICSFFVIDFVLKERLFRLASERWKRLLGTAIVSLCFLCSFIAGLSDGPGESILGHSIGIALGVVAVAVYLLGQRMRRQDIA